ncbi:MAG: hypothetical protein IT424_09420 [Pirellulales bacterium]|nr:hypothetical protein [Pirellulales bacterium]
MSEEVEQLKRRLKELYNEAEAIVATAEARGHIAPDEKEKFEELIGEGKRIEAYALPEARAKARRAMSPEELEKLRDQIDLEADALLTQTAKRGGMTPEERARYNRLVAEATRIDHYEIAESRARLRKQAQASA